MQNNPAHRVEEPLIESAPLAREIASRLCHRDSGTGESCAWYHGLWQYLRLMKLVTTPEHHADFYNKALGEITGDTSKHRVLIAGAADYSMLAHALAAFRHHAVEPELTVNDLCETPLELSRWYAGRVRCSIDTLCCDILELPEDRPFDLVCTHSFLGRFPPEKRQALVAKWQRVLRPGGRVVTVKRVRPGSDGRPRGFSESETQAFQEKVFKRIEDLRGLVPVNAQELSENARTYASRRRTWPVRSREEIVELFERHGFRVDRLTCAPVLNTRAEASGPGVLGGAEYAQIVATRL